MKNGHFYPVKRGLAGKIGRFPIAYSTKRWSKIC
jgi:hypothetical protein